MKDVQFLYQNNVPVFRYQNETGSSDYFEYGLPIRNDFAVAEACNYEVELLINPNLSKERHHYAICKMNGDERISIGVVFPVSIFDGSDEYISPKQIDYFAIAFYELLKRLRHIDSSNFSDNFENNICVCVFNLNQAGLSSHVLSKCIHSLRAYNYSYFIENNSCVSVEEYKDSWYIADNVKNIVVSLQEPPLYKEKIIDMLMRVLPNVNNIIHRFFLLYQVIEFLIAANQKQDIKEQIKKYQIGNIPENDFFDNVAHIKKEGAIIKEIFEKCSLKPNDYSKYVDAVKVLNTLLGYKPKDETPEALFYSFRNQMTHSLRNLIKYEDELARTIFEFERVVMLIIRKYP